jgi:CBS domain-containing protein
MKCPACGFDNIEGADRCEDCLAPFRDLDIPQPVEGLQAHLMMDPVRKVYSEAPGTVSSNDPMVRAVELMRSYRSGCVPVVDEGKLKGILSEVDILFKLDPSNPDLLQKKVSMFMTPKPEVLSEDSTIAHALHSMSIGGYRHLPVVRNGQLVGILSAKDILRYLKENLL